MAGFDSKFSELLNQARIARLRKRVAPKQQPAQKIEQPPQGSGEPAQNDDLAALEAMLPQE